MGVKKFFDSIFDQICYILGVDHMTTGFML